MTSLTLRLSLRSSLPVFCGASLIAVSLLASSAVAQSHPSSLPSSSNLAQQSPFGGETVEDIVARVNDQIITNSDYDRAMKEMDEDARQRGETMQQIADGHKDLLRNLIDQQLWLSKGKELGITGETELVKQLDEIRKKYNLNSLEDLEKAAQQQGVSFEDFKQNIRNQIITQEVMRDQVGRKVNITPGEARRYFDLHQQQYAQPESVHLAEILVSTGAPATDQNNQQSETARLAAAKAKADDIEAKLKAGADFDQLARSNSDGSTAAQGGDLGKFERGNLAKVLEDATFSLKPGQVTQPIRTRQGYVILKVIGHNPGGVPSFQSVEPQVQEAYYMSLMEPAIRSYLTQMREEASIDIRPGYTDSAASPRETKPIYSAYTPPAPKKKKKVERSRYRETDRGFRSKGGSPQLKETALDTSKPAPAASATESKTVTNAEKKSKKKNSRTKQPGLQKAGKKEKIRYGQAPLETLPSKSTTKVEDAGALPETASAADEPVNPLERAPSSTRKTRFSDRAQSVKHKKKKQSLFDQADPFAPTPPDPTEVANQELQSAPLGLNGDTSAKKTKKKRKQTASNGKKTRLQDIKEVKAPAQPLRYTPAGPVTGAPAPAVPAAPQPASGATPPQQ